MKYFSVILVIFSILLLPACGDKKQAGANAQQNLYTDATLVKIATLQDERDSDGLLPYLDNQEACYRRAAALAFASVQDAKKEVIEKLASRLGDEDKTVQSAVAYALGQTGDVVAVPALITAYKKATAPAAKRDMLEALGKCGDLQTLEFVAGLNFRNRENEVLLGQARGIYRFALRNITSEKGTARAFELLEPGMPADVALMAAHYLARVRNIDLTSYAGQLVENYQRWQDDAIRMSLVLAMRKITLAAESAEIEKPLTFLLGILSGDSDYRVKVNALRALENFPYERVKNIAFSLVTATNTGNSLQVNPNVAVRAGEYVLAKGINADVQSYFEKSKAAVNWRCRALLLQAALRYCKGDPGLTKKITDSIITAVKQSSNTYEKANLLLALGENPGAYDFIESQLFPAAGTGTGRNTEPAPVIKSLGMAALVNLRNHKEFPVELQERFAETCKKAIASGDIAIVGQAAFILRDPAMNFKTIYKDPSFLKEALAKLVLPRDIEAYQNLQETVAFFYPDEPKPGLPSRPGNPIDWQRVLSLQPGQIVKVGTTKGDIRIKLFVDEAPGSVANFVRLMQDGYFKNSVFHRVVPNFVVQVGCPRGDGWGGPDFSIRSEFGPLYYEEGSVGMASTGKDTESSQWFITHSPTPHLDGRYTIFGKVVDGMEVVHRLEIGDYITTVELLKSAN